MSLPFVLEHIDLIAAAPEGVKRLRELILELAVRGKLVPQDPNDEPASELLRRIQAEKAKLVAEGRIRKDKPLPEVGEDERPFELPALWEWVRLGAVTTFGQTDKSGDIDDSAWVLDLEDIEKDTSVLLQKIRFADRPAKSDKNQFQAGDVLYGKLRPYLNKVIVADDGGVCTTEILPVRGYGSLIYARYLMHALKRPDFLAYVNAKSYGMKMPRLGTDDGRMALFPLPPLPEQPRIVAKVDELMDLCDRLEAQQADAASAHATLVKTLLDTLTQSQSAAEFTANWQRIAQHFDNLFTTEASLSALKQTVLQLAVMGKLVPQDPNDEPASELLKRIQAEKAKLVAEGNIKKDKPLPEIGEDEQTFELPYGWEWVRFGAITRVCSELVKPEDFMNSFQVAPDCIEKGTGKLMERRTVRESGVRGPNQRFCSGQLLYSKIRPSLSKAVLVDFDGLCSADMYPLETHINRRFLLTEILSEVFLSQVRVAENRVKMPKLNQESLALFVVAVPPLPEQHRIVAKVDELMALCDQLAVRLKAARELAAQYATAATATALEAA